MAQIYFFDDAHDELVGSHEQAQAVRNSLGASLRSNDSAILLPGAAHSQGSLAYKNVVVSLDAKAPSAPLNLLHDDWGHGVSVVRVPPEAAERALNQSYRARALERLGQCCRNALRLRADGDDSVGPKLACDEGGARDMESDNWEPGFDGSNCSVGLYSALETRRPISGSEGMRRAFRSYFLVAKAGAGNAAQELSARISSLADTQLSLDEVFGVSGSHPDALCPADLERVVACGRRNRARILHQAAQALGFQHEIDTAPDHACCDSNSGNMAILLADAVTNVVERVEGNPLSDEPAQWRYYAGCVSPYHSRGTVACSSPSDGYVMWLDAQGDTVPKTRVQNAVGGCTPFGSRRIMSTADALRRAVQGLSVSADPVTPAAAPDARDEGVAEGHPDSEWLAAHFVWYKADDARAPPAALVPPQLWGTHEPLEASPWGHALGLGSLRALSLHPELVYMAGAEPAALRTLNARRRK
jgi:hypothetical protein